MAQLPPQLSNVTTSTVVEGWVSSPNGRGTLDILQTCLATVFLCTYSVLFLNVRPHKTPLDSFLHKAKWVLFTILLPESTTTMAAEQWRSAQQSAAHFAALRRRMEEQGSSSSVENLKRLQNFTWTARHAFFADMGGLHLQCPDYEPFPINSAHLLWLVANNHVLLPHLDERTIRDRNKADGLTRAVTLLQVFWFTVQVVSRAAQHLDVTTLELSTLAFACCTLHAFWFWRDKPLDVAEPITIPATTPLRAILRIDPALVEFAHTPLDFLEPPTRLSFVDPFFHGMKIAFRCPSRPRTTPRLSIPNEKVSHADMRPTDVIYGFVFGALYFGMHFAAWGVPFPTAIERVLWRSACVVLACIGALYVLCCWPGNRVAQRLLAARPKNAVDVLECLPRAVVMAAMWTILVLYTSARMYVIVEGFVNLRALPAMAYASVDWMAFWPHL